MIYIIQNQGIAFCAQVDGTRGEVCAVPPISLQSQWTCLPTESCQIYGHSWPQRQSVCLESEADRGTRNGETAMCVRYAIRGVVVTVGTEQAATGMSLTARTDRVHSDRAIPA
jgi:hypothetical protein